MAASRCKSCENNKTGTGVMRLYTIGHSNHTQDEFLRLLNTHCVNCVVDVRSVPASSHNPQFNQEPLGWFLREKNIDYQFLGRELGARRMDCINQDGQVDFERAIHTTLFQDGVDKLMRLLDTKTVTLMCSEAEPLECHRFALVARYFHEHGVEVFHILKAGAENGGHVSSCEKTCVSSG